MNLRGFLRNSINVSLASYCYVDATATFIEINVTFYVSVDGVIFTHVNIVTWLPLRAALTDDDVTWDNDFTTKFLNAEALAA